MSVRWGRSDCEGAWFGRSCKAFSEFVFCAFMFHVFVLHLCVCGFVHFVGEFVRPCAWKGVIVRDLVWEEVAKSFLLGSRLISTFLDYVGVSELVKSVFWE